MIAQRQTIAGSDCQQRLQRLQAERDALRALVEMEKEVLRLREEAFQLKNPGAPHVEMLKIAEPILRDQRCTLEQVRHGGRSIGMTRVRWRLMHALDDAGYGQSEIGRFLNCDHGTVAHALRQAAPYERRSP